MHAGGRHHHHTIRSTLQRTVTEEGVAGLFRGVVPTLLGILPYAGLKFYLYQTFKGYYRDFEQSSVQQQQQSVHGASSSSSSRVGSAADNGSRGGVSGGNGNAVGSSSGSGPASSSGSSSGSSQEGGGGRGRMRSGDRLPVPVMLMFGGAAGLVAQTVTYPLDVIRRQMQVQGLKCLHADEVTQVLAAAAARNGGPGRGVGGKGGAAAAAAGDAAICGSASSSSSGTVRKSSSRIGEHGVLNGAKQLGSPLHACQAQGQGLQGSHHQQQQLMHRQLLRKGLGERVAWVSVLHGGARVQQQGGAVAAATAGAQQQLRQQLQQLSMVATTRQLLAEGGIMRLFRGVSINYLKVVPSTAIGFTLYDAVKAYLDLTSNL